MTPGTISSGLVPITSPSTLYVPPLRNDWYLLFQPMFDELLNPLPSVVNQAPEAIAPIVEKFLGTVKFGNDYVAKIMCYRDYQIGNVTISRVYYVEGLGHNLFSVGQFCDSDLEIAFCQHTCFIRNLDGVDLLTGSWGDNLYTLSIQDMMASSPTCLLSKASKTKSWLWHRRLSHLNFGAINHLARQGLVRGLPKLKFEKDHLCSACAMGKSTRKTHKLKSKDTNQEKLYLLHMDLCGLMRVESVNGKKYILVIVDDYSRFTWVKSEEGTLELEDPQELLGSILLDTFLDLGFLEYTNVTTGLSVLLTIGISSLGGTIVGVAILVKGHTFPTSVNIHEVAFESTTLSLFKLDLLVLSDPLALETKFTPVEENIGVLESKVVEGGVGNGRFVEESSATLEFA
nr:retrovirus-related Pol polyprotein from transposon TNT 1-94 [Tanacetum cinerariifolium]